MIKTKPLKVVQPPKQEDEIPFEVLATSIRDIATLGKKLKDAKLTRRAVLVLLKDCTGVDMGTINKVLDGLPELEKQYLKG